MSLTLHTNLGDMKMELACAEAPRLCENFLALAAAGTYSGTRFHRNAAGFIVQGGDPTGTGKGGESIWGGFLPDEFHPTLKHDARGVVSLANAGRDKNGSQFFITYDRHPSLNNVYSVIGRIISGMDTLDKMERVPVDRKMRPEEPIIVDRVTIHANPFADREV